MRHRGWGAVLVAAGIALGSARAADFGRFLQPDQAFRLTTSAVPGVAVLTWKVADGYYLYRKRFQIEATAGAIGTPEMPAGEVKNDPNFGRVVVYRKQVSIRVPVTKLAGDGNLGLSVTYQGCADAGLCYTPITKHVTIAVPRPGGGAAAAATGPPGGAAAGSEQGRLAQLIERSNPVWFALVFFGLGILLAFTPCVLPMIPVLAGVVGGAGGATSARRGFSLSVVYVLAMAVVYTAAGVAAGLAGAGLQAYFQMPWVIALFAAVFVALAASLFGLYELRVPAAVLGRLTRWSGRQRGGTWVGAAVMGALSALIVSPCVAAPLAGALIVIGRAGQPLRGGIALFALALGMGAPLVAFGTVAGRLLPKAGAWMVLVERILGVALLAFAVWLLGRIVPGPVTLALWGLVGILGSVLIGAFDPLDDDAGPARRLGKGAALAAFAYAVVLLAGAAAGSADPLAPLAGLAGRSAPAAATAAYSYRPVRSVPELERAVARAAAAGRPVMLDFYTDWCTSCHEMDHTTLRNPAVLAGLRRMQVLRADVTRNTAADRALLQRYGLYGPPAYVFFDGSGRLLADDTVVGYQSAGPFLNHVRRALGPSRDAGSG